MKITLRLILSLIFIVAAVAFSFSFWQARQEEARLKNELERRANIVADSLKMSVEPLLSSDDKRYLQRIVDKFSNRERLVGIAIHDIQENLILASTDLLPKLQENPKVIAPNIQDVEKLSTEQGKFISFGKQQLHAYSVPLLTNEKVSHVLTIFHDAAYIQDRVGRIWINSFQRASIQAFLIALATMILVYLNIMTPIRKTTEWIRKVRQGESLEKLDPKGQQLLGPLANEITKMAKSLEMARFSAEEEARLRHTTESLWTPDRLKEFVRDKLKGRPLFVVSNREPYMHIKKGKEIECIVPASGLVTAIEPVLKACGGMWIAQGSGDADRETVDKDDKLRVPPEEPQYVLKRIWVDKELEDGFYSGFSNEGLWPLCHIAHTRPIFREKDWLAYMAVNKQFALAVVKELEGISEPNILIQDYHFALLPKMIKAARPDARVAIFWHIPWPNPESFGICPWQKEILQGMLGADIVGFHTQFHCNNFAETVDRFLESRIDYEHFTVSREGHTSWIKPFPISIDSNSTNGISSELKETKESLLKKHNIQADYMGVGVDRLDYTKGIIERFRAVEHFLEKNPEYIEKFTFVELGAPSRTMIAKYKEFVDDVVQVGEKINARFKTKTWQPILFLMKHHGHSEITPFYKAADVCLVTSLHDGMNLVAKEFVSARDDEKGVLILSQFTGASRELRDALIVNPYDIVQTAEAIKNALEMSAPEQKERMRNMRSVLKDHNIYRWASELVGELAQVRMDKV
ncbi:MAG TPA: trehalose-6-phosphate synthase [Candidatus Omnitrophota bacterium]|nr:trehalose-6-phosphate synthase [Candidatus Omnitrophota bacterium]HPD84436.1 trehalose-6-phosphate synthase [Candidatus Omnitrophota bacterium]HRZ03294.1 trehalose-6-phosphate synthase [Candidatus Omnitrophota bacterium]